MGPSPDIASRTRAIESNKGKSRFTDDSDGAGKKGRQTNFLDHREPPANGKNGGGKGFQHGGKKSSAKGFVKRFTSDLSETNTLIPPGSDVDLYNNMGSVSPAVPPTIPPPMFVNEHQHHPSSARPILRQLTNPTNIIHRSKMMSSDEPTTSKVPAAPAVPTTRAAAPEDELICPEVTTKEKDNKECRNAPSIDSSTGSDVRGQTSSAFDDVDDTDELVRMQTLLPEFDISLEDQKRTDILQTFRTQPCDKGIKKSVELRGKVGCASHLYL